MHRLRADGCVRDPVRFVTTRYTPDRYPSDLSSNCNTDRSPWTDSKSTAECHCR